MTSKLHQFSQSDMHVYIEFVQSHKHSTAYHLPMWGEAVKSSYGFENMYFGLFEGDQIQAVLPVVKMKNLKAQTVLCALPYCDIGYVLSVCENTKWSLLQLVSDYASNENWQFEYRDTLMVAETESHKNEHIELNDGDKVRMIYSLQMTIEEQLAFFKPKLRSQIKKAAKNGISSEVIARPSVQQIRQFYKVFAINMKDLGSPVHDFDWFQAIFDQYKELAFLVLVKLDEKVVGGGIVLHTNQNAVIPWASTLREYNKLAPNMLLYWQVLCEVISRNVFEFDFGRSGYNEGTFRFKKQWGALPVPLVWNSLQNGQLKAQTPSGNSSSRQLIENTWKKLPLGLTTLVGPKIRKYISL